MTSRSTQVQFTDRGQPAQLVLLHEVKHLPMGTKVRFLGCIEKFTIGSNVAIFSSRSDNAPKTTVVYVNVEAVLGEPGVTLDVGEWLNVIGNIAPLEEGKPWTRCVQAILAWPAGNVDLKEYEDAVLGLRAGSKP